MGELLLPSQAMDIMVAATVTEVTVEVMGATEATTTARGPLMLTLRPRLRLRLGPPPLLSPDIMAHTDTTLTDTDTLLLTPTDITTMARGLLMPSQAMGIMVTGTEVTVEDTMVMVMVTATDTTVEKFQKFMLIPSDFRVQYK